MTELGYPTTVEAMRERLGPICADPNYATFVADTAGCVVGVAGARLGNYYENDGMYCQLLVLAVSSTARGQGTGTQLVEAVERWAASQGARTIVVNSALHRGDGTVSTSAGSTPEPAIDSSSR
jgi:GNAT superfamily N-acetyltransferase